MGRALYIQTCLISYTRMAVATVAYMSCSCIIYQSSESFGSSILIRRNGKLMWGHKINEDICITLAYQGFVIEKVIGVLLVIFLR